MKENRPSPPSAPREDLARLRQRERELNESPSIEGFLSLAQDFSRLGMHKESARLINVAEQLECDQASVPETRAKPMLAGVVSPSMIVEVVQMVNRMGATGELLIETDAQVFHIFFDRGEILNAISLHQPPGVASFQSALQAARGTYRFYEQPSVQTDRLINTKVDELLLTVLQAMDEAHQRPQP